MNASEVDAVGEPVSANIAGVNTFLEAPLALSLDGNLARGLMAYSAASGVPPEDIVREAVAEMLKREQAARDRRSQKSQPASKYMTVSIGLDDGSAEKVESLRVNQPYEWRRDLVTEGSVSGERLYALLVQEMKSRNGALRRHVLLRECSRDYITREGNWVAGASFLLPASRVAWLIGVLERAQQALEADAKANRSAAQQARLSRAPEVIDAEKCQRLIWTEKRGGEVWKHAVTVANRHRTRALQEGRTNHFQPWEWLELCERFLFRCPICGIAEGDPHPGQNRTGFLRTPTGKVVHLQPHHRRKLSDAGENTITNILPLCGDCHAELHESLWPFVDMAPEWLGAQHALCARLSVGMMVTPRRNASGTRPSSITYVHGVSPRPAQVPLHYPPQQSLGVIIAITPPQEVEGVSSTDFTRRFPYGAQFGLAISNDRVSVWRAGTAEVRWTAAKDGASTQHREVSELDLVDDYTSRWFREKWVQEQQENEAAFAVGTMVRPKGARRTHRSQIIEIVLPDPILLMPVRAVILDTATLNKRRTIELAALTKADVA